LSALAPPPSLFRRHLWRWLVPLVLVVVFASVLSTYRAIYAGRLAALRAQISSEEKDLERLGSERADLDALVDRARAGKTGIETLYEDTFSTERERFTSVLREVRELAERSGLRVESFSYPTEAIEDFGLIERQIVFNVEGSYDQLRRFVNFMELADNFVVLRNVDASEGRSGLRIHLELSTLFAASPVVESTAGRQSAGGL
jgi:Tfp pilus assembly protein PilO